MRLIHGNKDKNDLRRSTRDEIVRDAFLRTASASLSKAFNDRVMIVDRSELKKAVYGFVRSLNMVDCGDADSKYKIYYQSILSIMGAMTPREFMETFPVTKDFNGHKYGAKDYFSVMEGIKSQYPLDIPIMFDGDDAHETMFMFLMNYSNIHTDELTISIMMNISDMHRMKTGRYILDDFMVSQGKEPLKKHYLVRKPNGKEFLVDEDGNEEPVRRSKPRYLREVTP